ncbi:MAG: YceI family protein [Niabella sp.]
MRLFKFIFFITILHIVNTNIIGQNYEIVLAVPNTVRIKGTSNISNFTLDYQNSLSEKKGIVLGKFQNNKASISGANNIVLNVKSFTSSNKLITGDFYKMLQADKYPNITIEMVQFIKNPDNKTNPYIMAIITIAGVKRLEILPINIKEKNNGQLLVSCLHKISLKNYKLTAPKKMMGMITVNDIVYINIETTAIINNK